MSSEAGDLRVEVILHADGDAEDLDRLSSALGGELRELPACHVARAADGHAPAGTRTGLPIDPGTLVVWVEHGAPALVAVIHAIQSWLDRRRVASVERATTIDVRLGNDRVVLTAGELSPEQRSLLGAFLAAHPDR